MISSLDGQKPVTVYQTNGGMGTALFRLIATKLFGKIKPIPGPIVENTTGFVWGMLRGSWECMQEHKDKQLNYIYVDHAYFVRGHENHRYRYTWNGSQQNYVLKVPDDRWKALGLKIEPWRIGGKDILVCPPSETIANLYNCKEWLQNTITTLRKHTDRPIRIRSKGKNVSLYEDLKNCHALVGHVSNVAVEAVLLGVPAFVDPLSSCAPLGNTDVSKIERPILMDRQPWAHSLAYGQWSVPDIQANYKWWDALNSFQHKHRLL